VVGAEQRQDRSGGGAIELDQEAVELFEPFGRKTVRGRGNATALPSGVA